MTLNPQQQQAFDAFKAFLDDPDQTLFCLLGRAGTGKSFTSSKMFALMDQRRSMFDEMFWCAPTWKAVRVATGFLDSVEANYEIGYDYFIHRAGKLICTTTQQA